MLDKKVAKLLESYGSVHQKVVKNDHKTQQCLTLLDLAIEDMGPTQKYDATLHALLVNPREPSQGCYIYNNR